MADDFDWSLAEAEGDLIIPSQPATAIYLNAADQIVIRQQTWPDDDTITIINPAYAAAFAGAILRAAGIDPTGDPQTEPPVQAVIAKDRTAAARQRRHRDKAKTVTDVTPADVTAQHADDEPPLLAEMARR